MIHCMPTIQAGEEVVCMPGANIFHVSLVFRTAFTPEMYQVCVLKTEL